MDTLLLKMLMLCSAGIIITQVLNQDAWTSLLFYATFPLTVLLWLRSVRKVMRGKDIIMLLTIALAAVNVLLDLVFSEGSLSFAYIKKLIMFSMSLLFFQTANRMRINWELSRFIDRVVDFLTIFLIVMYFLEFTSMHTINGRMTPYLTFRFSNPNTTGLFLTCLYMLEMYRLFAKERWITKTRHILMALFLGWFVFETQSRNCLLVLLLFTAACFWLEFRSRRSLHITKTWASLIAWSPLLFAGVYMIFVYTPWIQNLFSFVVDEGKGLDSRVRIWTGAIQSIMASPVIGSYNDASGGTGTFQMHNTHLDIAGSYGVPVLILVCTLLTAYLYQRGKYYEDKETFSYILAFACTIMLGLGEAALFSGGLGIYIYAGIFLLMSNRAPKETEING